MSVQFAREPYEFNFSKFTRHRYEKELPNEDLIIEIIASIALPPNDPLQQFMEEHENDMVIHWMIFMGFHPCVPAHY